MKIFLAAIGIFLASLVGGVSATVGPEVAVMQIKVGKEKEFQQVGTWALRRRGAGDGREFQGTL